MKARRGRPDSVAWLTLALVAIGPAVAAPEGPMPGDDATFRPTVMVRKGASLGTGTVIASVEGETLVLTASHVVEDPGPLSIELFRYNLGMERARNASGFPRRLKASVVARDVDADLAVLLVGGQLAFPYVARMAKAGEPLLSGTPVTSIGFDRGQRLVGSATRVRKVERIDLERGGGERAFLATDHPPELGRSGGGLFRADDGALVGVCVARAEFPRGRTIGLFSTLGNVRALLGSREDLAAAVARDPAAGLKARTIERSRAN